MVEHERLKLDRVNNVKTFHLESKTLDRDLEFIKANDIQSIVYYPEKLDDKHDLNWISPISNNITRLLITTHNKVSFDFSELNNCRELRFLYINNCKNNKVDVSNLSNLVSFTNLNAKKLIGLERLTCLKRLVLDYCPIEYLNENVFTLLSNLEYLCLSKTVLSDGLSFLKNSNVSRLMLYSNKALSLRGISSLPVK